MRAPKFWDRGGGALATVLAPAAAITSAIVSRRVVRPGWRAPVPVICCGNVTVGGAGKTTVALDLGRRLRIRGCRVHFLLRGYGGAISGPHRVAQGDTAGQVGDEALLLAELAPTWVGADRAASARLAVAAGADVLVLDDGLQNSTLRKDLSLLVVDGAAGFGNGRVLPAGPLRETIAAGAARCQAAALIGRDTAGVTHALPQALPLLRAHLVPGPETTGLAGHRVFAFSGIARPAKFVTTLTEAGATIAGSEAFADHHAYTDKELRRLLAAAARLGATPVTTAKDAVRLPVSVRARVRVADISLSWEDPTAIDALLLLGDAR